MHIPEGYNPDGSHHGPILAILVIVLILILGGLYLWGSELRKMEEVPVMPEIINDEPETPRAEADVEILNTMSPSDEIDMIEADITSTDIDSMNSDLNTIDAETNAVFGG